MEVHQHTHTARKKWTHYFWEFLMLFLAVTLGFFVENQREHIVERHRAKDYARSLVQDLRSDTANIRKWSGYYSLYISMMDSMIGMVINKQINAQTSGKFAWYCRHSLWHLPLPWQRTTLEQIKSTGSIRYFKNPRLQEMIAKYNTEIEGFMQTFILENPTSDQARDMTNKILDTKTYYEYSKINLGSLSSFSPSYIDSLTNRTVSFTNKEGLVDELVNMVVYRRRSYLSLPPRVSDIKKLATELINELNMTYHLE